MMGLMLVSALANPIVFRPDNGKLSVLTGPPLAKDNVIEFWFAVTERVDVTP